MPSPDIRFVAPIAQNDAQELAEILSSNPHEVIASNIVERCPNAIPELVNHLSNLAEAWQPATAEPEADRPPVKPKARRMPMPRIAGKRPSVLGVTELDVNAKGWDEQSAPHTRLP